MIENTQVIDRSALAREVWDSADSTPLQETEPLAPAAEQVLETVEVAEVAKPDVPDVVQKELAELRAKVGGLDEMSFRLKQTESRLGSVLNDLHASKEAAKALAKAPNKEQVEKSAKSASDWEAYKTEFPELAAGTEGRIAAERAEILAQIPDIAEIRKEMEDATGIELHRLKAELGGSVVSFKHPGWQKTRDTPEFIEWHAKTNGSSDSYDPMAIIAIFDEFEKYKAEHKSPEQIAEERQKRLALSETTKGHKLHPVKSEADMSASEIRASVAKQVWTT